MYIHVNMYLCMYLYTPKEDVSKGVSGGWTRRCLDAPAARRKQIKKGLRVDQGPGRHPDTVVDEGFVPPTFWGVT